MDDKLTQEAIGLAQRLISVRCDLVFKTDRSKETIAEKIARINRQDRLGCVINRAIGRVARREFAARNR